MGYDFVLEEHEKRELLRIARATLKEFLVSGRTPPGAPHRQSLTEPAGVFVTLHAGDDLRGCIGSFGETQPLYKAVQEMAVAAATRDPRFDPVTMEELPKLTIEISVLGMRRVIKDASEIVVGKHGLIVSSMTRRGLLLPQVAIEQGWDAMTFLERTCEKAGLPRDAHQREDVELQVFEAQVFDERTVPPAPAMPAFKPST